MRIETYGSFLITNSISRSFKSANRKVKLIFSQYFLIMCKKNYRLTKLPRILKMNLTLEVQNFKFL